eukprot:m.226906 g.226906  ORF g.226906 m.226906 type:complete len:588 (+) comp11500_c0_seq1:105-1868(+)
MFAAFRRRRPTRLLLGLGAVLLVWVLLAKNSKTGDAGSHARGSESNEPEQMTHVVSGVTGRFISNTKIYASGVFPGADELHLHGKVGHNVDGSAGWSITPMVGEETMEEKRLHHKGNCFNLARSDSINLDRGVPDARSQGCKQKHYGRMPTTSVVFVFFNEPMSPLLRSIHSVLDRTPPELLHEVIIVDDGSDAPWLKKPLEDYLTLLPKVKLIRMEKRVGLMATRTMGAKFATGETITFLDSHIEVNVHWLEPLMARIGEDRTHVVMPIIDSIDPDSFEYRYGGLDILAFSWSLGQKGVSRRRSDTEPMPSPIMAGGLFSMDRSYFFDLGAYDPEMRLYGGEEMEISFRIWQCGGTLECIPCSRVGHVFRTGRYWQGQVYPVPGDVIVKNKLRTAAVWMDEYKAIVNRVMPPLPAGMELGPLDHMQGIREKFQCKPFKWYLQNVYPEMFIPNDKDFVRFEGEIRNPQHKACFDTLGATSQGTVIGVYPCHGSHGTQEFVLSKKGEIRVASMDYDDCLDAASGQDVRIWGCHGQGGNQEWEYDEKTGHLSINGKCALVTPESNDRSPFTLKLAQCDANNPSMEWRFK